LQIKFALNRKPFGNPGHPGQTNPRIKIPDFASLNPGYEPSYS